MDTKEIVKSEEMTDKELFRAKAEWLKSNGYQEVASLDFYRNLFPKGSFEEQGIYNNKPNAIVSVLEDNDPNKSEKQNKRAYNRIVFDDLKELEAIRGKPFVITSPIGYWGRNRKANNARYMYAVAIDLDGVGMRQIKDLFYQVENKILPSFTYCINSGHGLHLYYLLEDPVILNQFNSQKFRDFKYALTELVWNPYTSTYKERKEVQKQGILQPFRVVGTQSKLGEDYIVTAYKTGERVTLEYLNSFLFESDKRKLSEKDYFYKSELSLAEAKKLYPEWYEARIVKGEKKGRWHNRRALYDWWLRKLKAGEATVGHRYWCLAALAVYAIKSDIDEAELIKDANSLLERFDSISDDDHNRFTQSDVNDAIKMYQQNYVTFSRKEIEYKTGITIPPNKRNWRKQEAHLKLARGIRTLRKELGEQVSGGGRPTAEQKIKDWQAEHPHGTPKDCIADTKLSKNTVYKWWRKQLF